MKNVSEIMLRWCLTYDAVYIISNCDATLQKMILYNPNVGLFNANVYTKFGLNKSFRSQDIEQNFIQGS